MNEIIKKIDEEIENQKKIWEVANPYQHNEDRAYLMGLQKAKEIIQAEQKKYKWEECPYDSLIKCPDCQNEFSTIDNCTETFNYCPNCGRKLSQPVEGGIRMTLNEKRQLVRLLQQYQNEQIGALEDIKEEVKIYELLGVIESEE